jgi:hypothetical protein
MNKLLLASLLLGAAVLASAPARAATDTKQFDVVITLTPSCAISTSPTNVTFAYQTNQGTASNSSGGGFSVTCTSGLTYSLSLDGTAAAGVYSYTDTATNLGYTLEIQNGGTTVTGAVAGSGSAQAFTMKGVMASGQAGSCAGAGSGGTPSTCSNTSSGNKTRTLTLTY